MLNKIYEKLLKHEIFQERKALYFYFFNEDNCFVKASKSYKNLKNLPKGLL